MRGFSGLIVSTVFCAAVSVEAMAAKVAVPAQDKNICESTTVTIGDWAVEVEYEGYRLSQVLNTAEGHKGSSFEKAVFSLDGYGHQSIRFFGYLQDGKKIFIKDFDPEYEFSDQAFGIRAEVVLTTPDGDLAAQVRMGNHIETFDDVDLSLYNYFSMRKVEAQTFNQGLPLAVAIKGDQIEATATISGLGFKEAMAWAEKGQMRFFTNVSKRRCPDFNNVNPDHQNDDGDAGGG